jgi:AraC-like DNA-binding protein
LENEELIKVVPGNNLERYILVESRNPRDLSDKIAERFRRIRIEPAPGYMEKPEVATSFGHVLLPPSSLSVAFLNINFEGFFYPEGPIDFISILYPVSGGVTMRQGGQKFQLDKNQAFVVSNNNEMEAHFIEGTEFWVFRIHREALERYLAEQIGHALKTPLEFNKVLNLDKGNSKNIKPVLDQIIADLKSPHSLLIDGATSKQVEQLLFATLIHAQPHNYQKLLQSPIELVAPYYVQKAKAYMRDRLTESIKVDELTEVTGVSSRSLYNAFQRYYSTSPSAWFKHQKLVAVKAALEKAAEAFSVKDIALQWGFKHMGNFSKDYSKAFGELPSETLKKSKALA